MAAYGVSVETCDQALAAIARPERRDGADHPERVPAEAARRRCCRRPSAAGRRDHRPRAARERAPERSLRRVDARSAPTTTARYNRTGAAFDVGETFSGVDFETGLEAVRRLAPHVPAGVTMPQWALRFVLDQPGMSVVIPGARNAEQARGNAAAARLAPLDADSIAAIHEVYDELIRPQVHARW